MFPPPTSWRRPTKQVSHLELLSQSVTLAFIWDISWYFLYQLVQGLSKVPSLNRLAVSLRIRLWRKTFTSPSDAYSESGLAKQSTQELSAQHCQPHCANLKMARWQGRRQNGRRKALQSYQSFNHQCIYIYTLFIYIIMKYTWYYIYIYD